MLLQEDTIYSEVIDTKAGFFVFITDSGETRLSFYTRRSLNVRYHENVKQTNKVTTAIRYWYSSRQMDSYLFVFGIYCCESLILKQMSFFPNVVF